MKTTIGQTIALHRKKVGLTQEELAEKCCVTAQAVSKWENDLSYPDLESTGRLAIHSRMHCGHADPWERRGSNRTVKKDGKHRPSDAGNYGRYRYREGYMQCEGTISGRTGVWGGGIGHFGGAHLQ